MTTPTDPAPGPATAPQAAPGRLRASDVQRHDVVHRLHDAVGLGLLTVEEGTERTAAAYAATYVDELPALTADLPDPAPGAPVPPGWRAVASGAALQTRMTLLGAPSWGAADKRRRWMVLLVAILVALLLVVLVTAAAVLGGHDVGGQFPFQDHDWNRP